MFKSIQALSAILVSLLAISGCTTTTTMTPRPQISQLTEQQAKQRSAQVQSVDYRLSLKLAKQGDNFSGQMTMNFELAANNQAPLSVDFHQGTIDSLKVNGKTIASDYQQYFLTIAPEHLKPGRNQIEIAYTAPYASNGIGLHRYIDKESGDIYLYSDFQPYNANRMFPSFDQPNLKATFTLDVIAPNDWQLISTTKEHKIEDAGDNKHWFFPAGKRITTYVFSLHAGPYHVWQDNSGKYPLRLFARKEVAKDIDAEFWFEVTHKSLDFLERYFDIDYPYGKYDQIIVPDYNSGAMENVAAVTFNEEAFVSQSGLTKGEKDELSDTIAHEAAHMWFGNLVTMDWWNGLWLNESFASYMAILTMDEGLGIKDAWTTFNSNFKSWGYRSDQRVTTHPIELPVPNTDVATSIFDGITYGKGAAVVAQLSQFVGKEAFKQGIRNYMKKYAQGNTTLDDFIAELASASGKDLSRWTRDWLYAAGVNTIYTNIECENGKVSKATIYQQPDNSSGTIRQHKLRLGFYQLNEDKVSLSQHFDVLIDGPSNDIAGAKGQACPPFVYANTDDLGYVKVDLKPQSVAFLQQNLSKFTDEQLRTMLWQDLWEKVEKASMTIEDFLSVLNSQYAQEQSFNVRSLLNGFSYSAFRYLSKSGSSDAQVAERMQQIERFMWQQVNLDPSDVERQKDALYSFVIVAHTPWGLEKVRQIFTGDLTIEQVPTTPDMRWSLVQRLNRYNYKDYQALTQQMFAEDDDEQEKTLAEIVRPDFAGKTTLVNRFIHQSDAEKLSIMRTQMRWIFPDSQLALYERLQQQIIDGLAQVAENSGYLYQNAYASRLIKGACSEQSVKRLEQAVERYRDLTPSLYDSLRVTLQSDQKCLKVRQFNF